MPNSSGTTVEAWELELEIGRLVRRHGEINEQQWPRKAIALFGVKTNAYWIDEA